jgi:hypothetical protein
MRGRSEEDTFPTLYRMNSREHIRRLFTRHGFEEVLLDTVEFQPNYLKFSIPSFLLGVLYERLVNSFRFLSGIRVNIFCVFRKKPEGIGKHILPGNRKYDGGRLNYYRRLLPAYLGIGRSHLTFWHETPAVNTDARSEEIGPYYQAFVEKADYPGPFDPAGVPQLDYRGRIGVQYNPIAIAQYGLANWNLWRRSGEADRRGKMIAAADWLTANLEKNPAGLEVWNHHFDWEYRTPLRAPWYSGLAQGQGISLLVRAHKETGEERYLTAARRAFQPLLRTTGEGGVLHVDPQDRRWIEEYLVEPPTHILNGFLWASWGVYDYALATGDVDARKLFSDSVETLKANLNRYDCGFWSLYELSGTWMRMVASRFYHRLHIVQLRVMHRLTGEPVFSETADRWERYLHSPFKRTRALLHKAVFKFLYY